MPSAPTAPQFAAALLYKVRPAIMHTLLQTSPNTVPSCSVFYSLLTAADTLLKTRCSTLVVLQLTIFICLQLHDAQAPQPAAAYLPLVAMLVDSAYAVEEQALMKLFFQSLPPNEADLASAKVLALVKAKPPRPVLIAEPDA
jgi:hypothetical protein